MEVRRKEKEQLAEQEEEEILRIRAQKHSQKAKNAKSLNY